jgi:hypothetical protein
VTCVFTLINSSPIHWGEQLLFYSAWKISNMYYYFWDVGYLAFLCSGWG